MIESVEMKFRFLVFCDPFYKMLPKHSQEKSQLKVRQELKRVIFWGAMEKIKNGIYFVATEVELIASRLIQIWN